MTVATTPTTLSSHPFGEGTLVEAYLRISETMTFDALPPGQDPVEAVNVAEGEITFSSLPVGDYWAVGLISGVYHYVAFRQQADPLEFIEGPAGANGAQGPPGPQGEKGAGAVVWRGDWDFAQPYSQGDAVSYGGASWAADRAVLPNVTPPDHPDDWTLMADKGQPGVGVPAGGAAGTWLRKSSGSDFATAWVDSGAVIVVSGTPSNAFGQEGDFAIDQLNGGRFLYKHDSVWTPLPPYTQVVTSLPVSPYLGQEVYLRVGPFVGEPDYVLWHLRWETGYPVDRWEFLGGMPIRQRHTSGGDLVGASTNTALQIDNTWLEVDLPANGIYEAKYIARDFGVTSGLSIATVEIQRMVAAATYTAGVGKGEQNHQAEYTANAAGSYLPFELTTWIDCRDKTGTYAQPPTICPTMQRASGGTWSLRGNREIIVTPVYLI